MGDNYEYRTASWFELLPNANRATELPSQRVVMLQLKPCSQKLDFITETLIDHSRIPLLTRYRGLFFFVADKPHSLFH